MTTRSALRVFRLGGLLALVLTVVWLFWPAGLGGGTTYVSTHGVSMQPGFETGDLAVLRPAGAYAVGDVIAFRSTELGTTVMHRIIAREGDRFVTQGDNNSWIDPDRPSAEEVLGRLWFRIPGGGRVAAVFGTPALLALGAATGAVLLWRRRSPSGRRERDQGGKRIHTVPATVRSRARQVAIVSGALALVCAAGSGALLLLPATDVDQQTVQVTQQGTYAYEGTATPGVTYATGTISTGDPIYIALLQSLTVQFDLGVTAPGLDSLEGSARLEVTLAAADGWTAPLDGGSSAAVADGGLSATVALDPAAATALLARHHAEIGTPPGGATIVVTPVVQVAGTVRGDAFELGTPTPLRLALDPSALRLAGAPEEVLQSATVTDLTVDRVTPHHVAVFGSLVSVGLARTVVTGLLVLTALTAAGAAWLGWPRAESTVDDFLVRHAGRLVEVNSFTLGATVIDVTDPEALHMVAERLDGLVLHHSGPYGHLFAVQDADTTYCYMVPAA